MKKKQKKQMTYRCGMQTFNTFKELKTYMYFGMHKETTISAYQMHKDEIIKEYEFTRQERRLLCRTIYDYDKINLENWNKKQLNLFEDG